MKIGSRLPELS